MIDTLNLNLLQNYVQSRRIKFALDFTRNIINNIQDT